MKNENLTCHGMSLHESGAKEAEGARGEGEKNKKRGSG